MSAATVTARQEWAKMWPIPVIAMLGYTGTSCFTYSSGAFMVDMTREFGWTRAQFSLAFTLQTVLGFVVMPLAGKLVDRIGPRRIAIAGVVPYVAGYALLALASGPIWQWWALCLALSVLAGLMGPTVWITAVSTRFKVSRGLALATVLAGTGVSTAIWPVLAANYLTWLGWRAAFPALAVTWAAVILPLLVIGFRDPPEREAAIASPEPSAAKPAAGSIWSPLFIKILIAGGLFASVSLGLTLHLIPILQSKGLTLTEGAAMAGISGIAAIAGRIVTGFLLDRLPTLPIAVCVFLLPIPCALLLGIVSGPGLAAMAAAALLGLAAGSETDVVVFMMARKSNPATLGTLYGVMMAVFAGCASMGPVIASATFDFSGSYTTYLIVTVPIILVSMAMIVSALTAERKVERVRGIEPL